MEALLHIKSGLACTPVIHRPREPVGWEGEGVALAMCLLQARQAYLPCGVMAQAQRRSFGKRPCEVGSTALVARNAQAFTRRCLRPFDPAAVRDAVLPPGATAAVMDGIKAHQGEALPTPGLERRR